LDKTVIVFLTASSS